MTRLPFTLVDAIAALDSEADGTYLSNSNDTGRAGLVPGEMDRFGVKNEPPADPQFVSITSVRGISSATETVRDCTTTFPLFVQSRGR